MQKNTEIEQPRESLELQKVTFVCGASPKKIFRKCQDFNVPIVEEKRTKNRLTVVLTCAGDGSKLKPLVIFKRKTMPKIANKHGVVVAVQQKGWMDENIMKIWIEKVWRSRIGGLGRRRSLLVLDSFEAHKTEQVKRSFKSENTDLEAKVDGMDGTCNKLLY